MANYITSVVVCVSLVIRLTFLNAERVNIKLVEGISPNQGYVAVKISGEKWQPLRDGSLGNREAAVVCRQLGFSFGTIQREVYETTIPDFLHDRFVCTGTERTLGECSQSPGQSVSVKNIYYYAGICCSDSEDFEVQVGRLVIGQCSVKWYEALTHCEGRNMTFSMLPREVTYNGSRYWIGQFFTPWIWSDGCFTLNVPPGRQSTFALNSPQSCLQFCGDATDTQFALSGEVCRCLGPTGSQIDLKQTLPIRCDSTCSGNKRFKCGGGHGKYWSLFSVANQEDVFYKVDDPRSPAQCAILLTDGLTSNKLQSEECSEKSGYVCSDTREDGFVGFLPFTEANHYSFTLQDARRQCHIRAKTLHLSGHGIMTSTTLNDRTRFNRLWVNIQRTATAIQIQNANISPSQCISIDITENSWLISDCQERYLYACSMLEDRPPVVEDIDTTPLARTTSMPYNTFAPFPNEQKGKQATPQVVYIGIGVAAGVVLITIIVVGACCIRAKRSRDMQKRSVANTVNGEYELIQRTCEENEKNVYDEIKDQGNLPENHLYYDLEDARKEASMLNDTSQTNNKQKLTEKISYAYPMDSMKDKHPVLQEKASRVSADTKYTTPYDSLPVEKT